MQNLKRNTRLLYAFNADLHSDLLSFHSLMFYIFPFSSQNFRKVPEDSTEVT